jgi:hypothetical protein
MALRYQKPSWPPGQRQTDSHCCCLYREFVFPVRPRKQIQRRNPPDNGEIHQLLEIHFIPRIRTVLFKNLNDVARDLLNQFNIADSTSPFPCMFEVMSLKAASTRLLESLVSPETCWDATKAVACLFPLRCS